MQVSCTECGVTVEQSYHKQHLEILHGICILQMMGFDDKGEGPTTYLVSFPMVLHSARCLVPGFPAVAHSVGRLREHFMFRQFWSQIAVVQEGKEPLPRCDLCIMHMPVGRLIKNRRTARCNWNIQMR